MIFLLCEYIFKLCPISEFLNNLRGVYRLGSHNEMCTMTLGLGPSACISQIPQGRGGGKTLAEEPEDGKTVSISMLLACKEKSSRKCVFLWYMLNYRNSSVLSQARWVALGPSPSLAVGRAAPLQARDLLLSSLKTNAVSTSLSIGIDAKSISSGLAKPGLVTPI